MMIHCTLLSFVHCLNFISKFMLVGGTSKCTCLCLACVLDLDSRGCSTLVHIYCFCSTTPYMYFDCCTLAIPMGFVSHTAHCHFLLKSSLEIVNSAGRTALQEAAHIRKQDVVKYLHSVDVNSEL